MWFLPLTIQPAELFFGEPLEAPPEPTPEVKNGQFCDDCPGCEWNGTKDQFEPSPTSFWCNDCGHLVCPKANRGFHAPVLA